MKPYVIGIDYGTLSARALLVEAATGREVGSAEYIYPHAVLPLDHFPGITLPREAALQHPRDYLEALTATVGELLRLPGVSAGQIGGVGVDFTASTVLPVLADGTPLCFLPEFETEPRAYVKLWKDHTARWEAERMTEAAQGTSWIGWFGGRISSEWLFPKLWETLRHAPAVFDRAARFVEAGDWIVWMLTGCQTCNSNLAGAKSLWIRETGYPEERYFASLDERLRHVVGTKVLAQVHTVGTCAGAVDARGAELTGLLPGTPVSVSCSDAAAAVPAVGVTEPDALVLSVGTSICHFLLSREAKKIPGVLECIMDGAVPGLYAYETGQASAGDTFAWYMQNCLPESIARRARETGTTPFALLDGLAAALPVGANGVLALDWWNGNRCPYNDFDLTGTLVGLTLRTRPEEIYRALLESVALGTRDIAENLTGHGLPIRRVIATGGIARKNSLLMQMFSDCLGMEIHISAATQGGALGSAIYAACAAGLHPDVATAARAMGSGFDRIYRPDPGKKAQYDRVFQKYQALCRFFGPSQQK